VRQRLECSSGGARTRNLAAVLAAAALAGQARPAGARDAPIQDNSFLLEEAYNQEPGVIQHVSTFSRSLQARSWTYTFTEEWPVAGQRHQASVTFGYGDAGRGAGPADLLLNYRVQAVGSGEAPVALAPRLSLVVPTGDAARGLGGGGVGLQVNLPLSAVLSPRLVTHVNLGATYVPSARAAAGGHGPLAGFAVGQSLVWLAHESLNFLVEALYTRSEVAGRAGAEISEALVVNPGLRGAVDLECGLQIVPGVSVPVGIGPSRGEVALFLYLSFEHPFFLAGPAGP
jgi:hypothetical protein